MLQCLNQIRPTTVKIGRGGVFAEAEQTLRCHPPRLVEIFAPEDFSTEKDK